MVKAAQIGLEKTLRKKYACLPCVVVKASWSPSSEHAVAQICPLRMMLKAANAATATSLTGNQLLAAGGVQWRAPSKDDGRPGAHTLPPSKRGLERCDEGRFGQAE